jgi:putative acetyltransferase
MTPVKEQVSIRPIQQQDNPALANVVRSTLKEFGANHPGTVYFDETTDSLYEVFQTPGSFYFVALINDEIAGGGGIYPSAGLPDDTCELVKMYLLPLLKPKLINRHYLPVWVYILFILSLKFP